MKTIIYITTLLLTLNVNAAEFRCQLVTKDSALESIFSGEEVIIAKTALDAKAKYLAIQMEGRVSEDGETLRMPYQKSAKSKVLYAELKTVSCKDSTSKSSTTNDLQAYTCTANAKNIPSDINLTENILAPSVESADEIFALTLELMPSENGYKIPYMAKGESFVRYAELRSRECKALIQENSKQTTPNNSSAIN